MSMETATGARRQPLILWITTAGSDPVTPCGDQHHYACQILDRVLTDETFFAFIAHADDDDPPFAVRTWRKANPNYGISVQPDDLRALARKAQAMPAAAAAFKQKRLNLWVNSLAPWLSLEGWRRGQSAWTLDALAGEKCWVGIDMSSKIDLTAVAAVFPPTATRARWRVAVWGLTPEDTLVERAHRDRAPYQLWVQRGVLLTNPGNRIDQDEVRGLVGIVRARFDVQQIGVDPWNAGNLVKDLTDDGFEVIEVPQTLAQMSAPAKEFEADVLDGLVDAGGNPLMTWCGQQRPRADRQQGQHLPDEEAQPRPDRPGDRHAHRAQARDDRREPGDGRRSRSRRRLKWHCLSFARPCLLRRWRLRRRLRRRRYWPRHRRPRLFPEFVCPRHSGSSGRALETRVAPNDPTALRHMERQW